MGTTARAFPPDSRTAYIGPIARSEIVGQPDVW